MQKLHRTINETPFLRSAKDLILNLLGRFFKSYFAKKVPLDKMRSFLFIRFEPHLGSIVCTSAIFEGIKKLLPDIQIGVICDELNYEFLKYNPNINDFYLLPNPDKNFIKTFFVFLKLRKELKRYDCIVADLGNSHFRYLVPTLLTGIKYRIGFERKNDCFFNITASYSINESVVDRNLNLLKIFEKKERKFRSYPKIYFSSEEIEFVDSILKQSEIDQDKIVVAIQTQSKDCKPNRWFSDRFAALADKIIDTFNAVIIFTGVKGEKEEIESIRSKMVYSSISTAGKTNVTQLAALLSRSSLFITLDTGSMHIGCSIGIPMIIIGCAYQPSYLWLPVTDSKHIVIKKDEIHCAVCYKDRCPSRECMKQITVDEVFEAVSSQMSMLNIKKVAIEIR